MCFIYRLHDAHVLLLRDISYIFPADAGYWISDRGAVLVQAYFVLRCVVCRGACAAPWVLSFVLVVVYH